MRADGLQPGLADELHGGEQARDAVAVARPGLKACGVLHGLFLQKRLHARAAHAPRTDLHAGRDAQAAGALRPHEALMPREAEDADVHALHVDGEHARRLRRVDHEQKPVRGAEIADPLQVEQVSRQVRACRAHHGLRLWPQQTFKVRMIDPALPVGGQEVRLHAPLHLPV